ncbi:MAG: hypothetical protein RIS47_1812 [Bacteroidota bacterium]
MRETISPLISIVTVCYNSEKYLEWVFESLAAQTFRDFEHIVIDGGSSDNTLGIIRRNKNTISYWISETDNGLYDALNKGFYVAKGKWIGILHSDDFFSSERALEQVANLLIETNPGLLYSDLVYVKESDTEAVLRYWKAGLYRRALLRRGWMPPHPTVFISRGLFGQVGGFDLRYEIAADYDFLLRCFLHNPVVYYLPEVVVRMRVGGKSNGGLVNIVRKSREDLRIISNHGIGGICTLLLKNLRKLKQFFVR